jgi:hypothetical protein
VVATPSIEREIKEEGRNAIVELVRKRVNKERLKGQDG